MAHALMVHPAPERGWQRHDDSPAHGSEANVLRIRPRRAGLPLHGARCDAFHQLALEDQENDSEG
jgi:hypothetical protein